LEAAVLDDPLPPSLPLAAVLGCHDPYSPKTFPSRFHRTGSSNQYSIEAEVDITDDFSFLYNRLHSREVAATKVMFKVVGFIRMHIRICCSGASLRVVAEGLEESTVHSLFGVQCFPFGTGNLDSSSSVYCTIYHFSESIPFVTQDPNPNFKLATVFWRTSTAPTR
jgi:hypothetical protein